MWAKQEDNEVACYISNVSSTTEENIHAAWKERKSGSDAARTSIGLAFCERTLEEHGGTLGVVTTGDGNSAMRMALGHMRMQLRP